MRHTLYRIWHWLIHGPGRREPDIEPADPHTPPLDDPEDIRWQRR